MPGFRCHRCGPTELGAQVLILRLGFYEALKASSAANVRRCAPDCDKARSLPHLKTQTTNRLCTASLFVLSVSPKDRTKTHRPVPRELRINNPSTNCGLLPLHPSKLLPISGRKLLNCATEATDYHSFISVCVCEAFETENNTRCVSTLLFQSAQFIVFQLRR